MDGVSIQCRLQGSSGISSARFNPWNDKYIAISTWGSTVELYDTTSGEMSKRYTFKAPQLCAAWADKSTCISSGADGIISANGIEIGAHDSPVGSVAFSEKSSIITSGSYDGILKMWDYRGRQPIIEHKTPSKIYCIAAQEPYSVICVGSERFVTTIDTRKPESPISAQSPIQYQARSIAAWQKGYAIGLCEGRIAIEPNGDEGNKFAFKAHYHKDEQKVITVYPVHSLCFDPGTEYLASGGGDGKAIIWNLDGKCKVKEFGPFETSVSAVSFSSDGEMLAIAVSYCFENGQIQAPDDRLFLVKAK